MSIPNNIAWPYPPNQDKKNCITHSTQMFNSVSSAGIRNNFQYTQMPPPTGTPWNTSEMPWVPVAPHPNVVNFTGEEKNLKTQMNLHTKRKAEFDASLPTKQHITEEKMAAQFNSLHISSNFSPTSTSFQDYEEKNKSSMSIEERLKGAQQVVLSEEMKKLRDEPIIPRSLLERLERPCMSLVLWKAPSRPDEEDDDDKTTTSDNNNNPDSDDQPVMDVDM